MSNYRSFVKDFPARCERLLQTLEKTATGSQYDVSSAITFAAASVVIPFERLRHDSHPSNDASKEAVLKKAFGDLMRERFVGSRLIPGPDARSWCFGRLSTVKGDPDAWPELLSPVPLPSETKARDVIFHLRNALSHGNIFTRGDPIQRIVFLSETDYGSGVFKYLVASPADFRDFLQKWFFVPCGRRSADFRAPNRSPESTSPSPG